MEKTIWVASANPVKIQAALKAFSMVFPGGKFNVEGIPVPSGVPDQPIGVEQTLEGARNRVEKLKELQKNIDFYVGMEGGITTLHGDTFAFAWMYIETPKAKSGKAMTGYFQLPGEIQKLLEGGMELGHAIDNVFSKHNSKQEGGAVGMLTGSLIDRTEYYVHAMILALIPFNKEANF
jgi:inosine/xanthosine triphosphatase